MHVNQRFRFNYVLGNGPVTQSAVAVEDDDSDEENDVIEITEAESAIDLAVTSALLSKGVDKVSDISSLWSNPRMNTDPQQRRFAPPFRAGYANTFIRRCLLKLRLGQRTSLRITRALQSSSWSTAQI